VQHIGGGYLRTRRPHRGATGWPMMRRNTREETRRADEEEEAGKLRQRVEDRS